MLPAVTPRVCTVKKEISVGALQSGKEIWSWVVGFSDRHKFPYVDRTEIEAEQVEAGEDALGW